MINEPRTFASLSSGLLARKGTAKPAMRPQGYAHGGFDDLGWNDMGQEPAEPFDDAPEHVPSSIAALTPAPRHIGPVETAETSEPAEAVEPEVVAQQRAIAESFEAEAPPAPKAATVKAAAAPVKAPAAVVKLPKRVASAPGRKAAFTLRVDAQRHLRLRLATAVTGRSAQQLVTEALDRMLASIPEIESLAERVPASAGTRS